MQNSAIFCARSASAGGGTRCFSQCLIFWCFWIKTKARKKESKRFFFRSILRETILPLRLCVSCKERIYHLLTPKGGAKSVRRVKNSGTGRRLAPKTLRGRARARVFDGAASARSSSRFFARRRLRLADGWARQVVRRIFGLSSFSRRTGRRRRFFRLSVGWKRRGPKSGPASRMNIDDVGVSSDFTAAGRRSRRSRR